MFQASVMTRWIEFKTSISKQNEMKTKKFIQVTSYFVDYKKKKKLNFIFFVWMLFIYGISINFCIKKIQAFPLLLLFLMTRFEVFLEILFGDYKWPYVMSVLKYRFYRKFLASVHNDNDKRWKFKLKKIIQVLKCKN